MVHKLPWDSQSSTGPSRSQDEIKRRRSVGQVLVTGAGSASQLSDWSRISKSAEWLEQDQQASWVTAAGSASQLSDCSRISRSAPTGHACTVSCNMECWTTTTSCVSCWQWRREDRNVMFSKGVRSFPGQSLSRTDVSRTRRFPDRRFPDKTIPGQTFPG